MAYARHTRQFKEQAMLLVTERGMAPTAAARELGMPRKTLELWLKQAGWRHQPEQPVLPLSIDPAVLQVRVRELEEENRRLRMEKDILKKRERNGRLPANATAFFASQNP
jgi:transposase